jgi:hypothetical protein
LYFLPLPHVQGSFLPMVCSAIMTFQVLGPTDHPGEIVTTFRPACKQKVS